MIVYLDASALVKRYVTEPGSEAVAALTGAGDVVVGTAAISRAEVSAALGKAVRLGMLSPDDGRAALGAFRSEWPDLVRLRITEAVVGRADHLSWTHGLRGYDAVHLAAALLWQEALEAPVVVATFDRELARAAREAGLTAWPEPPAA